MTYVCEAGRRFCVRSELSDNVADLTPKLGAVVAACEGIIESESLTQFLAFILQTGNFMNMVIQIRES